MLPAYGRNTNVMKLLPSNGERRLFESCLGNVAREQRRSANRLTEMSSEVE